MGGQTFLPGLLGHLSGDDLTTLTDDDDERQRVEASQTGDVKLNSKREMTSRHGNHVGDVAHRASFQRPAIDRQHPVTLLQQATSDTHTHTHNVNVRANHNFTT